MDDEWILPTATTIFKNRDEIASIWTKIADKFAGKKFKIAITGISGIGKTDLYHHLLGLPESQSPSPTEASACKEEGKTKINRKTLCMTTVPGQQTTYRLESISDLFDGKNSVDGVIHVVANGFTSLRSTTIKSQLIADSPDTSSLEGYRIHQRARELEDLRELVMLLRISLIKSSDPKWLCLAVTKSDLFSSNLSEAKKFYCDPKNDFALQLNNLIADVGKLRFRWFAMPTCATMQPFQWNDITAPSEGISDLQRNAMVKDLLNRIAKECTSA